MVEALGRRRQELYANPDVTRIGEVCADESPCADQLEVQLGDMAGKGWHIEGGDPYTVLEAQLEDFDGDTLETSLVVTVVGVIERPASGGQIVDANGNRVTSASSQVTIALRNATGGGLGGTGASLSGDPTRNAVAGLAQFPDLTVNYSGLFSVTVRLRARFNDVPDLLSNTFVVTAD